MASSIKVVLRKKRNKQGLFPIAVRIIKERKTTFYYTGHYLESKHWNEDERKVKKSHPNSARLNNLIAKKIAEANKTLLDLQANDNVISSLQIKQEISNPIGKKSFNELAEMYLQDLEKNDKLSRLSSDKPRVNHFIKFTKFDHILFTQITESLLRRFMAHLKTERKVSERSIINNLIVIRTIYNKAIKLGIVEQKLYPFGSDKIRIKFPETEKVGLSIEEVRLLENVKNLTEQQEHARNIWLFSFYFAGMRIADVLKIRWNDIYDGRLHYRMNKNAKFLSLKLPEKALPILKTYEKEKEDGFIFPDMKKANLDSSKDILAKTKTANRKINKYLTEIADKLELNKKLTMHIARHTFGNISGDKIPIQMLQKLYRHSSITTTINYQSNFTYKDEDEALDTVINF